MQANESNVHLKVKAFKWIPFLKPFFLREIVDAVRQNQEIPLHGFMYFLLGIYEEFGVGAKTNRAQALKYYKLGIEKDLDAFCAQRLAEIHSEPNHMQSEVSADFAESWKYVLVSVALMKSTYGQEITQGVEALQKIKSMADNDLSNSLSQLLNLMSQIGRKIAYANAIHHLAYIQVANDKFVEADIFNQAITLMMQSKDLDPQFVWETLFQYTISQSFCENHHMESIYAFLLKGKAQMLLFVKKIAQLMVLIFLKLPQDCDIFKHFRYILHELMLLRNDRVQTQTKTEGEIDGILNLLLKNLFMLTMKRIDDTSDRVSIIRSYAEIVENKDLAIDVLREEYQFKLNEEMNAYTHYRIASFNSDCQSAVEGLKYAEKLFLTRIQQEDSNIVDKFVSAYFLGKITHKLSKLLQNSDFKHPIKTDLSQILPESDISRASIKEHNRSQLSFLNQPTSKYIQRQLDFTDYYIKAYLLYTQYISEFYSYQTLQFQMVLHKIKRKLRKLGYDLSQFQFEPQVNTFFSINSIRLSQIRQNQTQILQISQINTTRVNINQQSIKSQQIELKTLIRRGSESQLYSGILNVDDQHIPCLFKVFPGLSEKQCSLLQLEIEKWSNVSGINHLYGCCIESTQGDHYQFYIVQEALSANLLQMGSISFQQRLSIMFQLATTVKGFHAQKLYHGNLKPENVLLKYAENKTLVYIGDYAWPKVLLDDETDSRLDVYGYASPETMASNIMSFEADIWSVGVLFLQILSEYPLRDTIKTFRLYETQREWKSLDEAGFSRVTQLVSRMVNLEPSRRPTMEQVLKIMKGWNFSHQF